MSATTTVKTTRHGIATLKYCNHQAKAHNGWNMKRVLALSAGLGLTPDQAEKKMQEIWREKGTQQKHQIEAYTIVQSFDPKKFDWKSADDIKKVNDLGNQFAKRAYAGRLYTVSTQADGTHHVLHNHITVCSQDPVTLKSLRGVRTSVKYTREINDEILKEVGYTPIKSKGLVKADSMAMRKLREKHPEKPLRVDVIRDRLDKLMARKDITNFATLIKEAKEEKLDIRAKFTKQGKLSRVSYRLLDDDENLKMTKGIRPKRLGEIYGKDNLTKFLQANAEYSRNQERNKQDVRSTVQGATRDFEANFERTIGESPTVQNGRDRESDRGSDQSTIEASNSSRSPQTSFQCYSVYFPRSAGEKLRSARNAVKRPRRKAEQPSQPTNYSYPNFKRLGIDFQQARNNFNRLKYDFDRTSNTADLRSLWRNIVFDDDTVRELKELFREYADLTATPKLRRRTNESTRTDSRSYDDASNDIDFDF